MQIMMNQLPRNILVEIFSHLGADNLIAACKVCQLWSCIIKTTPEVMRTVSVKLTSDRSTENITILDQVPSGLHQNLEIIDYCADFMMLKQVLSMHKTYISCIKIVRPAIWRAKMFTETFSQLRNLSQLTLDNCQLRDIEEIGETDESGENFVNLRHLTIVNCCCDIFEIFKDCNLTSLTIEYSPIANPEKPASMKCLTNFLKKSSKISNLSISGITNFPDNFLSEKLNFKFQLQHLKMDEIEGFEVSECCAVDFLESQRGSLKTLSIMKSSKSEKLQNLINEIKSFINCDNKCC
ncbi:uncharacterized protein [Chironomus tepperi]|uniref:uncharacterized protein n=1 Tax=Chironomus tepperi TaxID=113505 RepID=UPI00391F322D